MDTIKELFEGNGALFEGLAIHDRWDWSKEWPVVRISFGSGSYSEPGQLQAEVEDRLGTIERANGLSRHASTPAGRFAAILRWLHGRAGRRVVVLVDEYDKPILDPLTRGRRVQDGEGGRTAYDNRDFLRGPLLRDQGRGRPHPLQLPHRGQQVLQGEPVLRPEQPDRHHSRPPVLVYLRLHRPRPRHRVRAGTARPRPWTGSATGTTATTGWATRSSTTRSAC